MAVALRIGSGPVAGAAGATVDVCAGGLVPGTGV